MVKQLFKSKKAESWPKVLLFIKLKSIFTEVPQGSVLRTILFLV